MTAFFKNLNHDNLNYDITTEIAMYAYTEHTNIKLTAEHKISYINYIIIYYKNLSSIGFISQSNISSELAIDIPKK